MHTAPFLLVPVLLLVAIAPASLAAPVGRHHPNNLISRAIDPSCLSLPATPPLPPSLGSPTRAPRERSRCCAAVAAPSLWQSRFRSPAPAFAAFLASFLLPSAHVPSSPGAVKSAGHHGTEVPLEAARRLTESGLQSPLASSSSSNLQMG